MTELFDSLMADVLPGDVTSYPDFESAEKARKDLDALPAGHCAIFSRTDKTFFEVPLKAAVMMQMRFDGAIGFAGGLVDRGEEVTEGLNRELKEEINLDIAKYGITVDDFVCCHSVRNSRMWQDHKFEWQFNYFFAKEVTEEEFLAIERGCLDSKDHGQECLGSIRVPLYVWRSTMGFPRFLTQQFAGTALAQLLIFLRKREILSQEDIVSGYRMYHPKDSKK